MLKKVNLTLDEKKDKIKYEMTLSQASLLGASLATLADEIEHALKTDRKLKKDKELSKKGKEKLAELRELEESITDAVIETIGDKLMESLKASMDKKDKKDAK